MRPLAPIEAQAGANLAGEPGLSQPAPAGARLPVQRVRALEPEAEQLPMAERIARAAARLDRGADVEAEAPPCDYVLRPDQVRVFRDFASFLLDLATDPGGEQNPFGRIILPPRTGKTVIAGHLIARTGLRATFIVPTKTLVLQTAGVLRSLLPDVPIGVYFGEQKELVAHGVNIATYAILLRDHARGAVPEPIARSALVLVDEAHRAMTEDRMALLRLGFPAGAIRVALTATPDYDEERVLCRFFPRLIHEVTLEEALTLGLLAPARVWVAEVDAEGSRVRILAGDYDEGTLGRVMSAAPFARAVEVFRYRGGNARLPALVACTTRQQAYDLQQYLLDHRPAGAPRPEVVLGETSPTERARILGGFEAGEVDTLIQVGVLLEGWSSPRCKLLLDLAPTLSRVRATQKYFRVMTKHGDVEARIYVLLPRGLPELPILPMELFGRSCGDFASGELIGRAQESSGRRTQVEPTDGTAIAGVVLKKRIVLSARLEAPKLDPGNPADVRAVLGASRDFDPEAPCNLRRFCAAFFEHSLFTGRGAALLRWLGVPPTTAAYAALLARSSPGSAAGRLLLEGSEAADLPSCRADALHLLRSLPRRTPAAVSEVLEGTRALPSWRRHGRDEGFAEGWRALTGMHGLAPESAPDPLKRLLRLEQVDEVAYLLQGLSPKHRRILVRRFGLLDQLEDTDEALAEDAGVSRQRIPQIAKLALRKLRRWSRLDGDDLLLGLPSLERGRRVSFRRGLRAEVARSFLAEERAGWADLPAPLPVRELLPRISTLLVRLGMSSRVTEAEPLFREWLEDGVAWGEASWEDGGIRIQLLRFGHATWRHEGGEADVMSLWAEITGLPQGTRLTLKGPLGTLEAFAVRGEGSRVVESVWLEVCQAGSR